MIAVERPVLRGLQNVETHAGDDLRKRKLRERRWLKRVRSDSGRPAEDATVMILLMRSWVAWTLTGWTAKPRCDRSRCHSGAASNVVMMMQNRNGKLHAECDQREPDQSEAALRCFHQARTSPLPGMTVPSLCHNRGELRLRPWCSLRNWNKKPRQDFRE